MLRLNSRIHQRKSPATYTRHTAKNKLSFKNNLFPSSPNAWRSCSSVGMAPCHSRCSMRIQLPLKSVRTDLCALRVAPMTESRLHCLQPLIHRTRNDRNQDPYQGCMGDLPQIQTRVDMKNYMLKHRLRLFGATVSPRLFATQPERGHPTKNTKE